MALSGTEYAEWTLAYDTSHNNNIYRSIVKAVIVNTVALVKLSAANLWNLQTVSSKGYSRNQSM